MEKVKKLFIIGNGFDLNLHYPTRFKDFVNLCYYWNNFFDRENKYDSLENINNYKLNYINGKAESPWTENSMKLLQLYPQNDDEILIKELNSLIINNKLIAFIINNKDIINQDKWSDFEKYLLQLCKYCDEYIKMLLEYRYTKIFQLNPEFELLLNDIFVKDSFFDFGMKEKIKNKTVSETLVFQDKEKFIKELYNQLLGFNKAFNLYLKCFIFHFEIPQWESPFNDSNSFVLNFNYTYFAEKIFSGSKINYIHGFHWDDDIVIGITDESLGMEYNVLQKKYMRLDLDVLKKCNGVYDLYGKYDNLDDFIAENYENAPGIYIDPPIYVIIIGHSLSSIDWDVLSKYLTDETKNIKKVFVCYHGKYKDMLLNLMNMYNKYENYEKLEKKINDDNIEFVNYVEIKDLLKELDMKIKIKNAADFIDLNSQENEIFKFILEHEANVYNNGLIISSNKIENPDAISYILESLQRKGYIEIEETHRVLNGPKKPYKVIKILKR